MARHFDPQIKMRLGFVKINWNHRSGDAYESIQANIEAVRAEWRFISVHALVLVDFVIGRR